MNTQQAIDLIMTEMFSRVGETYTPEYTKEEGWYWKHSWSLEEEEKFVEWLSDLLYTNAKIRRAIVNFPIKNKTFCKKQAKWFIFNYGWKTS